VGVRRRNLVVARIGVRIWLALDLALALALDLALILVCCASAPEGLAEEEYRRRGAEQEEVYDDDPEEQQADDDGGEEGTWRDVNCEEGDVVVDCEEGIHRRRRPRTCQREGGGLAVPARARTVCDEVRHGRAWCCGVVDRRRRCRDVREEDEEGECRRNKEV
jgi:hypothetical protein